jgi:sugar lactone lactonase YvrE
MRNTHHHWLIAAVVTIAWVVAWPTAAPAASAPPAGGGVLLEGAAIKGGNGVAVGPNGMLYVASLGGGGIVVVDPDHNLIAGQIPTAPLMPEDLAFGPDGSTYFSSMWDGHVARVAPDGTVTAQMVAPGVTSLVISGSGHLYATVNFFADMLVELDPELVAPPQPLATGLGGLKGMAFGPDGKLYGGLINTGEVTRIDLGSEPVAAETVAGGFVAPFAAKFDPQGRLWVLDRGADQVVRLDAATGAREATIEVPPGLDNLAMGPDGRVFSASYSDGYVVEIMPDDSVRTVIPGGMILPLGLAVLQRGTSESLFVADVHSLRELDPRSGEVLSVHRHRWAPGDFPGSMSLASDAGRLLLSSWFGNFAAVWDVDANAVVEFYPGSAMPLAAVRFAGDIILAERDAATGDSRIVRISGGSRETIANASNGIALPLGLAADGGGLWASDKGTGTILQLGADGALLAQPRVVATGLAAPAAIAVDRDGSLLVIETAIGRLSRVDPATGHRTTLFTGLTPVPPPSQGMSALVGDALAVGGSGTIFVADTSGNRILALSPVVLYLPAAAHATGVGGSDWRTDLMLHNAGAVQIGYTVEALERGKDNSSPRSAFFTLDPERSVVYRDVLQEIFQLDGTAALRITATGGTLLAAADTHTSCAAGRCGSYIDAIDLRDAVVSGQTARLIGLQNSAAHRTNLGLVSATGAPISVEIDLFAADGTAIGTRTVELRPFEYFQETDVFGTLDALFVSAADLASVADAYAVVLSATPDAHFFAYASVVDNHSGDPMHVPAR